MCDNGRISHTKHAHGSLAAELTYSLSLESSFINEVNGKLTLDLQLWHLVFEAEIETSEPIREAKQSERSGENLMSQFNKQNVLLPFLRQMYLYNEYRTDTCSSGRLSSSVTPEEDASEIINFRTRC